MRGCSYYFIFNYGPVDSKRVSLVIVPNAKMTQRTTAAPGAKWEVVLLMDVMKNIPKNRLLAAQGCDMPSTHDY